LEVRKQGAALTALFEMMLDIGHCRSWKRAVDVLAQERHHAVARHDVAPEG
jgi:hypothetical protein